MEERPNSVVSSCKMLRLITSVCINNDRLNGRKRSKSPTVSAKSDKPLPGSPCIGGDQSMSVEKYVSSLNFLIVPALDSIRQKLHSEHNLGNNSNGEFPTRGFPSNERPSEKQTQGFQECPAGSTFLSSTGLLKLSKVEGGGVATEMGF